MAVEAAVEEGVVAAEMAGTVEVLGLVAEGLEAAEDDPAVVGKAHTPAVVDSVAAAGAATVAGAAEEYGVLAEERAFSLETEVDSQHRAAAAVCICWIYWRLYSPTEVDLLKSSCGLVYKQKG
jgi:hypothetical protein